MAIRLGANIVSLIKNAMYTRFNPVGRPVSKIQTSKTIFKETESLKHYQEAIPNGILFILSTN